MNKKIKIVLLVLFFLALLMFPHKSFAKDLDEICSSVPHLQQMIKEEDKKVIRLENNDKNNV